MSTRTFKIYGTVQNHTDITVCVNDQLIFAGPIDISQQDPFGEFGTEIVSFEHSVETHGYSKVKITVNQGQIVLGRSRVIYPAEIKNPNTQEITQGSVYILQPIPDPKYLVRINGQLQTREPNDPAGEWHYELPTESVIEYYHLCFNGPNYWKLPYSDDFFDCFQTKNPVQWDSPLTLTPVFLYRLQSCSFEELERLKLQAQKNFLEA